MFADICVAFAVAILLNMFGQMGKLFKSLVVFAACVTLIVVHFINGPLTFIGSMDLSIWLMFTIVFDYIVQGFEYWLRKKAKES
jgi:hypothetical protein